MTAASDTPSQAGAPLVRVAAAWLAQPQELARAGMELLSLAWALQATTAESLSGAAAAPLAEAAEGDDRFADPVWREQPFFHALLQQYLALSRTLERQVYDTPGVSPADSSSAAFWVRQCLNAFSPSNFLWSNPEALRRAWSTGGASLRRGLEQLSQDVMAGDLRMVGAGAFELGVDLAPTAGDVVFRNRLMELIRYRPVRAQVHAQPIVIVPPWINKYYILDLTEQKSMVRYLVGEGFDVYILSWKNPGAELSGVSFEDHLFEGLLAAIDAARAISGSAQVHAVGYCIGGTALAALMAWLARACPAPAQAPVAHWTLLATLTSFARPGDVASFISDDMLAALDALMARQGYLDASQIGWSFRLLRPNSQVWRYVVHKYLLGEAAPAMAPLAWNADGTRQPPATHSFILRQLYVENRLAQADGLRLRGQPLDLARIRQPAYVVGALADHITPWRSTYDSAALLACPVRYALTSSGHILGIVNPPGNGKHQYWAGPLERAQAPRAWQALQASQPGSWWNDWSTWLHAHCGAPRVPAAHHPDYPVLAAAPGVYVRER